MIKRLALFLLLLSTVIFLPIAANADYATCTNDCNTVFNSCYSACASSDTTCQSGCSDAEIACVHPCPPAPSCGTDCTPPAPPSSGTTPVPPASSATTSDSQYLGPVLNVNIPTVSFSQIVLDQGKISVDYLPRYISGLYQYLLGFAGIIAVIMIMIGGVQYVLSSGTGNIQKAKERITNAITGLVLLLFVFVILYTVNPNLTSFDALKIAVVPTILDQSAAEGAEQDSLQNFTPSATEIAAGNLVTISGDHLVSRTEAGANYINADVLAALNKAADAYFAASQKNIVVTSGSRTPEDQAGLFYNNCLAKGGVCSPTTCDITYAKSGKVPVMTYDSGSNRYTLIGSLAGVTDKATIVAALVANGHASYCPHTSYVAVDMWPEGSGGGFVANVSDMQTMMSTLTSNGFCRLVSEAWHYELNSKTIEPNYCSTSNNSVNVNGHTVPSGCTKYNFKDYACAD